MTKNLLLRVIRSIICLIIFFCACSMRLVAHSDTYVKLFKSLDQLEKYSLTIPEFPMNDSDNWLNPSFVSLYTSRQPKIYSSLKYFLGLNSMPWNPKKFIKLLEFVVNMQEKKGYRGDVALVIDPNPTSQFIIISDLQSAFHALVRYLKFLNSRGLIDENLCIKDDNVYIIFNGNACIGFAYSLDTLAVIAQLIANNPDHVFYLLGTKEVRGLWRKESLTEEIRIRFRDYLKTQYLSLNNLIVRFFELTLLAIYLKTQTTAESLAVVRISNIDVSTDDYFEKNITNIDSSFMSSIKININTKKQLTKDLIIKAWIKGAQDDSSQALTWVTGNKIPTWQALSCPVGKFRTINQFMEDSFVILKIDAQPLNWVLDVYTGDPKVALPLGLSKVVKLLTGEEKFSQESKEYALKKLKMKKKSLEKELSDVAYKLSSHSDQDKKQSKDINQISPIRKALHKEELSFGVSLDLSSLTKDLALSLISPIRASFDFANKHKTIPGLSLKLVELDDEYLPSKSRKNVLKFLNVFKIDKLICPMGTPTLNAFIDLVQEGKLLVLFPASGSPIFRRADVKNIIHFRASYEQEADLLAKYAINILNAQKIIIFYQFDVPSIDGVIEYFNFIGFKNYIPLIYRTDALNYAQYSQIIQKEKADTIIFLAGPQTTVELLRTLGRERLKGVNLLGWSDLTIEKFRKAVKEMGLNFIISSIVPNPLKSTLAIARNFRTFAHEKGFTVDGWSFEGFICSNILLHILKGIDSPITKEKILAAAEQIKDLDLGGISLTFNPENRTLSSFVWLDTGSDDWMKINVNSDVVSEKFLSKLSAPFFQLDQAEDSKVESLKDRNSQVPSGHDKKTLVTPQRINESDKTIQQKSVTDQH